MEISITEKLYDSICWCKISVFTKNNDNRRGKSVGLTEDKWIYHKAGNGRAGKGKEGKEAGEIYNTEGAKETYTHLKKGKTVLKL